MANNHYIDPNTGKRILDRVSTITLPLLRSKTVGFDRLWEGFFDDIPSANSSNFPPYNIIKVGDNTFEIELAVAGFHQSELDIEVKENSLTVRGKPTDDVEREYLHRGIARRAFERVFTLADHVEVISASVSNGTLVILLDRQLPEEKQPKRIAISFTD